MKRRIFSPLTGLLYMTRFYLWGAPKMPDGSSPLGEFGEIREGAVRPSGWQIFLHRIARSDDRGELHNHPWSWGISLVLWGGYYEHRRVRNGWEANSYVTVRRVRPLSIVVLRKDDFHRVELVNGKASYSLFIAGPMQGNWGFRKDGVGPFVPASEFTRKAKEHT